LRYRRARLREEHREYTETETEFVTISSKKKGVQGVTLRSRLKLGEPRVWWDVDLSRRGGPPRQISIKPGIHASLGHDTFSEGRLFVDWQKGTKIGKGACWIEKGDREVKRTGESKKEEVPGKIGHRTQGLGEKAQIG